MTLAIDWGNTQIKVGWFDGYVLRKTARYTSVDELRTALAQTPPMQVIAASTSRPADELRQLIHTVDSGANWLIFNATVPVPIRNDYETPHTLGADRLAAAVGAAGLFPNQPCLILDLGTCLTADFVAADGAFQGGLIAPGLRMRLQAMHTFTARLPLIDPLPASTEAAGEAPPLTARNTRDALWSGALNGMALELDGLIEAYSNRYPGLRVLVCGGDAPLFVNRLKPGIFAVPELVLEGLNRVLQLHTPL